MKTKILIIFMFFFLSEEKIIHGQEMISEPYDIKEYFFLIPENILKIEKTIRPEILKIKTYREGMESGIYFMLDTLDYKNGYMKFQSLTDGEGSIYEITYFILKNNERIIAINFISWSMCCEDSYLKFYKLKDKKWINITTSVLPDINISDFYYDIKYSKNATSDLYLRFYLPQKGKNIKVKLADTFFEYMNPEDYLMLKNAKRLQEIDLIWNNGNFLLNK